MTKKLIVFLIVVLSIARVSGQIQFQEIVIDSTKNSGLSTFPVSGTYLLEANYSADLDSDGDIDIITHTSPLKWFENTDGQGDFDNEHIINSDNIGLLALDFADIDNDGDVDIFTSEGSNFEGQIAWYENTDGLGDFSIKHIVLDNVNTTRRMEAADLDGDGDFDLITADFQGNIFWFENTNGLGEYGEKQVITTIPPFGSSVSYLEILLGDFDGDMDIDIIFAANGVADEKVYMLENANGQGDFANPLEIVDVFGGFWFLRTEDLDNDGDLDLFGHDVFDDMVVYLNNGFGDYTYYDNSFVTPYNNVVGFTQAMDIDNDGDMDLVSFGIDAGDTNLGGIILFENLDGFGDFSDAQIIKEINFTRGGFRFNIADLDTDGYSDIVAFYLDGYEFSWNRNLPGLNTFGPSQKIINDVKGVQSVIPFDADNDGDSDIVFASNYHNKIGFYENINQFENLSSQQIISSNNFGANHVLSDDFDGDGLSDLLVSSASDNKIEWFKNNGIGDFIHQPLISNSSESVGHLMIVDLDNDNDLDVVALELVMNKIVWYENLNGQGEFGIEQIIVENLSDTENFDLGDIDGDGDLDMVFNKPLSWMANDGEGNFATPQTILSDNNGIVKLADLNGDFNLDILMSDPLGWYNNENGSFNFGEFQLIDNRSFPTDDMLVVDIDNDGDLDIISAYIYYTYGAIIELYKNVSGVFTEGSTVAIIDDRISSLASNDMDGNGTMDILYASRDISNAESKIAWLKNLGESNNLISGKVTYDSNSNGCDETDAVVPNMFVASVNGDTSFATFTDVNGEFALEANQGEVVTLITPSLPNYFSVSPELHFSNFLGENETDNSANFCIVPNSAANDLIVTIYPLSEPRPGFDISYEISYRNIGTTSRNGSIDMQYDSTKLEYTSSSEVPNSQLEGLINFDFIDLVPFESRLIIVDFNVFAPPTTNIDDTIITTASINPISGDITENDNVFILEQTVIGSYDPNDILVIEGEEIPLEQGDDYLHYIIRFQNTGTAEAINVRVTNVIDSNLDFSTLELEGLSHEGQIIIENGILATFNFEGINLPSQSQDDIASNGHISYKIKPKSNVALGDIFFNEAAIYFDFNPPIFTNVVFTEIVDVLSLEEKQLNSISIYPNPTYSFININSNVIIEKIKIYDINGREIKSIDGNVKRLSIENMSKGIYFLKIESKNKSFVKKIIKI